MADRATRPVSVTEDPGPPDDPLGDGERKHIFLGVTVPLMVASRIWELNITPAVAPFLSSFASSDPTDKWSPLVLRVRFLSTETFFELPFSPGSDLCPLLDLNDGD